MPESAGAGKLTKAKQQAIGTILAVGGTLKMAADHCGCLVKDIKAAAKADPRFATQLRQYQLRPQLDTLTCLFTAARDPKQWRAAAWALERMYPARYGPRKADTLTRVELARFVKHLVKILAAEIPQARTRQRIERQLAELMTAHGPH
ncbi:MAG: hypothetical protein SFX18_01670 [Pirellulales bacterium]|nr:hypothetical protein [Pirellulales bacterium]